MATKLSPATRRARRSFTSARVHLKAYTMSAHTHCSKRKTWEKAHLAAALGRLGGGGSGRSRSRRRWWWRRRRRSGGGGGDGRGDGRGHAGHGDREVVVVVVVVAGGGGGGGSGGGRSPQGTAGIKSIHSRSVYFFYYYPVLRYSPQGGESLEETREVDLRRLVAPRRRGILEH